MYDKIIFGQNNKSKADFFNFMLQLVQFIWTHIFLWKGKNITKSRSDSCP